MDTDGHSTGRFFGYPDEALAGTWTVRGLQDFLGVSERKARALMKTDGAPAPLRLGSDRCDRWNPYQVVAWLHGQPEAASSAHSPTEASGPDVAPAAPARLAAPGRPWTPPARASAVRALR